jgi:hypothetical protein
MLRTPVSLQVNYLVKVLGVKHTKKFSTPTLRFFHFFLVGVTYFVAGGGTAAKKA